MTGDGTLLTGAPFPTIVPAPRRRGVGWLFSAAGWTFNFAMTGLWLGGLTLAMEVWGEGPGFVLGMLGIVPVLLLFPTGVGLISRGRRLRVPRAADLLRSDPRPPVLLLRSFDDDDLIDPGYMVVYRALPHRYEQRLVDALRAIGPVLALGRPGEEEPELGAARLYVDDAHWQEAIRYFMARSAAVVAVVGRSPGLWWEIELALKDAALERLLLFFPYPTTPEVRRSYWRTAFLQSPVWGHFLRRKAAPRMEQARAERYRQFRDRFSATLPRALPVTLGSSRFVCFEADGTPVLIPPRRPLWLMRVLSLNVDPRLDIPFARELRAFRTHRRRAAVHVHPHA